VATPEPDTATPQPAIEPAIRVSTLELFFDLVFVFTLTQLTNVLVHHLDFVSAAQVLLMLGLIWWMYGGYAWLTNAVAPSSTTRRTLLLTGMAGFLIIALAIPDAFGESGWLFGIGYFVVNLVHTTLFIHADRRDAVTAIRSLGPINFVSATLILIGGFTPDGFRYALWAIAFLVQGLTPYLHRIELHSLSTGHFVERHGLVIIVAIGESIVAIGLGFVGIDLDFGAVIVALLGLCISYYLWWAYFAGDDVRSEHALAEITEPLRRTRVAVRAWAYAHFPMVLGIVVLAAGVKKAVGHAFEPLGWGPASAIAVGVALFLLGHAWFLRILRIDGVVHRSVAAAAVLATIPLGHVVAVAQLAVVPLIMATAMIVEDVPRLRRSGNTSIHDFGRGA
jgi:low temperature requirement protein LtrA